MRSWMRRSTSSGHALSMLFALVRSGRVIGSVTAVAVSERSVSLRLLMTSVSPWSTQGGQRNPLTRDRRQDFDQRGELVDTIVRLKTKFIHLHPDCLEHGQRCDEIAFLEGLGHGRGRHPLDPRYFQSERLGAAGIERI